MKRHLISPPALRNRYSNVKKRIRPIYRQTKTSSISFIVHRPILSMLIVLLVLFGFIVTQSFIRKPELVTVPEKQTKEVDTYSIGTAPRIRAQAKIEKSGVIKIMSQTSGIVQEIYAQEGQEMAIGSQLAFISTNYNGASAATVSRQISGRSLQFANETLDTQKELIKKQRDAANIADENGDKLREINEKSVNESKNLLTLNNEILTVIDQDLKNLESTNSAEVNRNSIQALKQQKTSFVSASNALNASVRSLEYTTGDDNVPASAANITRDISLRQLDIQEKSIELNRDLAKLQYTLAVITESLSYPAMPCFGVVEKVHVKFGEQVNPGTVLFTISTTTQSALAVALVSGEVAAQVSRAEPSTLRIGSQTISIAPTYVSQEATDGTLYSVYYPLPEDILSKTTNNGFIDVEIPVGYANTGAAVPFVPLDAIHQTTDGSYVYLAKKNISTLTPVTLGVVYGSYVEVKTGLHAADRIILDRSIIEGEKIKETSL